MQLFFSLILWFMASAMEISSSAFKNGGDIPSLYTCQGENISPPLSIKNVPDNAKSLSLIVMDPDAPSGPYCHLVIFNMDPVKTEIKEAKLKGTFGTNSF